MKNIIIVTAAVIVWAAPALAAPAASFLTDAMKGDNSEVTLGSIAAKRGASAEVRAFGSMMVKDHGMAKGEVATLAKKMGVPTTEALTPEATAERTKLMKLSGTAFDREFASYMVNDHREDIAKFEAEAESSDGAAVTALAAKTLPTLKRHLAAAEKL